jgi:hypothetical protein
MKLEQYFEGAIGKRGMFTGYHTNIDGELKKDAVEQKQHIDWQEHYSGRKTFGLSPVKIINEGNTSIGLCRWFAIDVDKKVSPEKFCSTVFKINREALPVSSTSGRWHVYYFLDDWTNVIEARELAKALEKKLVKVYGEGDEGVDTGHTVPRAWTVENNLPGYWLFMPYSNNKDLKNIAVAYSPSGKPLTKTQCEHRIKYRKHPLIAGSVAFVPPGRHKILFNCGLYLKQKDMSLDILKEINQNFNEPLDEIEFVKAVNHIKQSVEKEEYNKDGYLEEHIDNYIKEATGIYTKTDILGHFKTEEETEEQKKFIENVIYMKLDDFFFDNSTEQQYPRKNMNIIHGHIATKETGNPMHYFAKHPDKKMVELGVYRPDLYREGKDPITKNQEGLLVLNHFRPGKLQIMLADTPERKKELDVFVELVKNLTEKEGTGTRLVRGKEVEFELSEYLLDHLSMPFKRYGVKTRSSIVLHSKEFQTGKSTLFEIVRQALGEKNCTIIKPENAISRELSFIEHQLVFVDEIKIDGSIDEKKSTLNRMKPLITQELHDSRPLFKPWRQVHSTCNLMFSTNHKDAMALDHEEARYTCIDVNKSREQMGGDDFFPLMWNWLKYPDDYPNTFVNVVKGFLTNRKFTPGFDPAGKSLKTNFLREMAEHGGHPLYTEVKNLLEQREVPFNRSVISVNQAWLYMKKEYSIKGKLTDFVDILFQCGAERVGECNHYRSRKKPMMFIIRNHDFFADKLKSQIVNEYWLPNGVESIGSSEWNLTAGDVSIITKKLKEIEAYEDFHDTKNEVDKDVPWIELKRRADRK